MNANFFHLKKIKGKDWLVDPQGKPFISKGVTTIYWEMGQAWKSNSSPYHEAIEKKYGSREEWSRSVRERLKRWGFNSLQN